MTREEKIEILIEDRLWEWVYASCTEDLKYTLREGFVGFDSRSDAQLDEAIEDLGEEMVDEIQEMLKGKLEGGEQQYVDK